MLTDRKPSSKLKMTGRDLDWVCNLLTVGEGEKM